MKFYETANALKNHKSNNEVWLKQQPLILHVACRNLDSAKVLLNCARKIFKRAGIISITGNKIMLEVIGTDHLDTLIKKGKIIPDEKYLKELVKSANGNFEDNKKKIRGFLKIMGKI